MLATVLSLPATPKPREPQNTLRDRRKAHLLRSIHPCTKKGLFQKATLLPPQRKTDILKGLYTINPKKWRHDRLVYYYMYMYHQ